MDSGGGGGIANNSRYYRKPPYSDRLLSIFSTSASTSSAGEDELSEHDIFDSPSSDSIPSTSSNPNPNPNHHQHNHHRHSPNHKHFGILAALPESESHAPPGSALLSVSSSSSSSSSSARLIPTIPKRPPPPPVKYLQSAPVNVPVMLAGRGGNRHFDDVDDNDEGHDDVENGEMLPPHELVASRHQTLVLASSVLEGAGRKLKGRDLRQVRNAIWRRTGFLD